ncbi:TonB-dependent receptor [Altererythrobacter sp. B11]|uniref:TonB-dependent receptor n=1 Tax=Altererythrobacter sp. B11 TaxID=2060312 RepID=UPI0018D58ECC|nr:TonB-dependent receptor [Altererythrobacter sp. B11]
MGALTTGVCVVALAVPAQAQAQEQEYNIPAGSLRSALDAFGRQSGKPIIYKVDEIQGLRSRGFRGTATPQAVLDAILAGTVFTARIDRSGAVAIVKAGNDIDTPSSQNDSDNVGAPAEILVTGSRIRGSQSPSPTVVFSAEQIHEEGFQDLGELIRSVPQNFGGGQNPGVGSGATTNGGNLVNQNLTGGSALNLRGLGPDATLTLLNGRRLSYTGFFQGVDISAIPLEAVQRVDIVPDGASAIYGSDAVGGVGNVILKRDFSGLTVGALYGGATDGGLTTEEYDATAGLRWSSGGIIATFKHSNSDPIFTDQRDYTADVLRPTTIYSGNDLDSGLVSAHQSLSDAVTLHVDAMHTERNLRTNLGYPTVYYQNENDTKTTFVAPGVEFSLKNGWRIALDASWSRDKVEYRQSTVTIATGDTRISEGCYCNESRVYELGVEGPLLRLPAGTARLAAGAGYRTLDFETLSYTRGTVVYDKHQNAKFAYAELNLPLISPEQAIPGLHRLTLTAAVRGEDYDTFGTVATPKFGVILDPSDDFTLRGTWGRSFKAPTLYQLAQTPIGYLYSASALGGTQFPADATVLMAYGGNPDLKPERARTWTASLGYHPSAVPGLEAEVTYFDVNYTDRVLVPIADLTHPLLDDTYSDFIDYAPTEADKAAIVSRQTFYNIAGTTYDSSKVVGILYNDYTNAARWKARGIDVSGSYAFQMAESRLALRASLSWLDSAKQNSAGQPAIDLSGTIYNPAEWRSRAGGVWTLGGLGVSVFGNYTSSVTNVLATGDREETGSFLTFDATIRYKTGDAQGLLSGLEFTLSAQNLFDRTPPLNTVSSSIVLPYDSTNYSGVGRYVSASISKHF